MRHISRALPTLTMIDEMPTMSYRLRAEFAREGLAGGEIEDGAGRGDVLLDHENAPGAVEAAQGEGALRSGHLVVVTAPSG